MTLPHATSVWLLSLPLVFAALSRADGQNASYPLGVQRIVESARAQGLPLGSILTKAAQGMQLHSPVKKIVSVAQDEATRLSVARALLGARAPDADLQAGASALSYKIPSSAISAIRQARPSGSVAVPLGVLTQLVQDGEAVQPATKAVVGVMRRGVTDPALVALREQIMSDVASGEMSIESAAELRFKGLTAALPGASSTGAVGADPTSLSQPLGPAGTTVKPPVTKPPLIKPPIVKPPGQ